MSNCIKKEIEIDILRVSPDGKLLEFIFNCPDDYHLSEFGIETVDVESSYMTIGKSLGFGEDGKLEAQGAFALSLLDIESDNGILKPHIYKIHLECEIDSDKDVVGDNQEIICKDAYVADVSKAYDCLIEDIIAFDRNCGQIDTQDRVIRNYLMVYGILEALRFNYIDEAIDWFNKMNNCFAKCDYKYNSIGCNCTR